MVKVVLYGGMGAILNCAIALHSSPLSLNTVVNDLLLEPFSVIKTLLFLPAALGFLIGTVVMIAWTFMRAFVIRSLLQYNGWFLTPRNPINKLWYFLMVLLLGKKNLGAGNYQKYLPSLPVPSLNKTCKRYLESVQPLLTKDQYDSTVKAVKLFRSKEGKVLQRYLKLRSWTNRNWISEWWEEYIYLRQRTSIAFNSNYYCLGPRKVPTPYQLDRAATILYNGVQYGCKYLRGETKNFMAMNLVPFCMHCMPHCSNATRIPCPEMDRFKATDISKVRHTIILRHGRFYSMQVIDRNGRIIPASLLKKQMAKIIQMAGDGMDETGVMTFTALPRDQWASIRSRMEQDPVNKHNLELIDTSFAITVLDTKSIDPQDYSEQAKHMFHGTLYDRWFDKSITVVVTANSVIGSNVEHGRLDATVAGQAWEYMIQNEEYDDNGHVFESPCEDEYIIDIEPQELKWNLESFEDDLKKSKDNLREMINDSDLIVVSPSYGKSIPKQCKLSPDGWFQMAIQLAYYRMYNKLVLTYESATTRLYYKGRTETIRPVSMESKRFVQSMDDPSASVEECKGYLKAAIQYQEKYKFEAMRGMGVDRHLFGLYIIAKWLKMDPMPELFQDEAFQLKFHLSTSQTPTQFVLNVKDVEKMVSIGGFGTVTSTGYGVSYIISGENIVNYSIHCKRSCPTTDSKEFGEAIKKAFEDMKSLFSDQLKE